MPMTSHSSRLGLFNARSISNKSLSLNDLFTCETLDFLFLTETWQREGEHVHLNELCPAGCSVFGMPRPSRRGGGLAVVFKESFQCKVIKTQTYDSFESLMIKIDSARPFYSVLVYRPPGPAAAFLVDFSDFLSSMIKLDSFLILGDFNIHVDDRTSAPALDLLSLTDSFNLQQHVSEPTHQKGHTLDLVFTLGVVLSNLCVKDAHLSDHSCVTFNLFFTPDPTPSRGSSRRRIIAENTAARFSAMFNKDLHLGCDSVDSLMSRFNSHCVSLLDEVAPMKTNVISKKSVCPWLTESIRNMKRCCRKTERLWKATKLEVHRLHLKDLVSSLNEKMSQARSEYFRQLISHNKKKPQVLFDTISRIVEPASPPIPVNYKADCDLFLQYFVSKIHIIRNNLPPCAPVADIPAAHSWSSFTPVTQEDISALLTKTKPSVCPSDPLPCKLLLQSLDVTGPFITKLINQSLSTGVFPSAFKHAFIEPLLKKTNLDPTDPKNFRPISKLPFLSKVLEKVVFNQLSLFLQEHDVLDTFQSGFRKHHSTETALLKVSSDIMMSADCGRCTVLVLLDLSSAFDTIDHEILLTRLQALVGMSDTVLSWFSSYLSGRSLSVLVNQLQSDSARLEFGVPQGSVLGPVLFLLYILPLGRLIKEFAGDVSYHLFADDIQLYCSFQKSEVQKLKSLLACLGRIKTWLGENALQLNSDKTEVLLFAPDDAVHEIQQHLGDLSSSIKPSLRNLGVFFDGQMSLEHHSKQLVKNCFFHLRNISKIRSMVSKGDLEMIIHAFVSSRLDYCNSLFSCLTKKDLSKLQYVQNSAARLLSHENRRAHITPVLKSLHWLPVSVRIEFKILLLTFRALHGQAPSYI